jgi:hypothetical protein
MVSRGLGAHVRDLATRKVVGRQAIRELRERLPESGLIVARVDGMGNR